MSSLSQIQRYLFVIRRVRRGGYPSLSEIREHVERECTSHGLSKVHFSERTVERTISEIKSGLDTSIEYSRARNGYFIPDDEGDNHDDIERVLESFDILNALQADHGFGNTVLTEPYRPLGTEHLFTLLRAAKQHFVVEFTYDKFDDSEAVKREITPYAVRQVRGRWYLIGFETKSNDVLKSFGLDRISDLAVQKKQFTRVEIDIKTRFHDSFGIMVYDHFPVEDVVLEFDSLDGSYLKSLPLHHSQQILEDNSERFVVSVHLRITHDFLMEISSRCSSLKVISPESLRIKVVELFEKAVNRNKVIVEK
ncbi:helix-turn-helix transcriptional regulator [Williamwhitmania taraxaci]|uniref:Predicted DNA-binding transcriptional regulator YafY, contains an HTH and WYL domains n=1 Tax=Williamwhitmania taraxaci TaxID=1640674 RepID=A0A1G6QWH8_9BACT|nr:WYL domain-containing protein [Williamwhitmania taraxaci]SDC96593.1 Predicted DNA-binding transcriptional regulator YafY, contains an HTH and WYL domains [Williamwhitmania taraxaci]